MSKQSAVSPPKISFSELMSRLADDSVPDKDLVPYLIPVPSETGRIDPVFQPNPMLVHGLETGLEGGLLVNGLNARSRRRRQKRYRKRINDGWDGPRVVDEGDSWFQYPFFLDDIIDHLMEDHAVLSFSGAGHTLADMIGQNEFKSAIAREKAHAFMLSAGGNDLFQNGNIANLIEPVFPGASPAQLVGETFDRFIGDIITKYRILLMDLHRTFPRLLMMIHGYAPAQSRMDRWIGRPLKQAGVTDNDDQNEIVRLMLARVNDAQAKLSKETGFDGMLVHIDLTQLGAKASDWYDEIHMDSNQNKLAAGMFAEALAANLPKGGLESGTAISVEPLHSAIDAVTAHAQALLALDEDFLLAELDHRIAAIEREPNAADLPSAPLMILAGGLETGELPASGPLAQRLVRRWELELYGLVCGQEEEDSVERNKLRKAIGGDTATLVAVLTSWLVTGPLGVSSLLAGVLAAILVKRFGGATYEVVCTAWKERLFDSAE